MGAAPWTAHMTSMQFLLERLTPHLILVPIALEDFGLVPRGGSAAFFARGGNRLDGALPVNTHGGLLSEGYFHGLNTIAEAVRQLRGASANQVPDAAVALVTVRGASSLVLGRA